MGLYDSLGEAREVELPHGTITYHERGTGPPVVLVHGLLVSALHWRKVVPHLAEGHRVISPTLPLGGHERAMRRDADLSPSGIADLVARFLAELDLRDVTLVTNDTATAIGQLLVADHPERLARAVLTSGDAFTNFLPWVIKPVRLQAFVPGAMVPLARFQTTRVYQRAVWSFLAKRPPSDEVSDIYFRPAAHDRGVRRDLAKFIRASGPRVTLGVARRLGSFRQPVLLPWTRERQIVFPFRHAPALAARLPDARVVEVEDSFGFIPEDQPERLSELIAGFVEDGRGAA